MKGKRRGKRGRKNIIFKEKRHLKTFLKQLKRANGSPSNQEEKTTQKIEKKKLEKCQKKDQNKRVLLTKSKYY